jgi:hypothetical protein
MDLVTEPVQEDVSWQIELTVAEALAMLGRPQNEIVNRYLDDPRSYVRRYASKILYPAEIMDYQPHFSKTSCKT